MYVCHCVCHQLHMAHQYPTDSHMLNAHETSGYAVCTHGLTHAVEKWSTCLHALLHSKWVHVGRQHALTWRLTSIEKTAATSYCWIHWQGFPTFVRAFVCVYQSKQYTYLFVQTWVLSQQPHNALSILCPSLSSLSPPSSHSFSLTLCLPHTVSPSLSLSLW